ncbi:MAG: hypothetical protein QOF67_2577, partial [Mycobacterium sp.]|nr:hypothetical protein [Mycobacterium sp.]
AVGLVSIGGSAFTGTGVTNNAGASQFVGGTVDQTVSGATLSDVAYTFGDAPANTAVHSVALTFAAGADGKTVEITISGGNAVAFNCEAIGATTANTSTCLTTGADIVGATSLAVTVS